MSTTSPQSSRDLVVVRASLDDPRAEPLISGLTHEYTQRYGNRFGGTDEEMKRYPAAEFAAPSGSLLLLLEDGRTVAGGAFRRYAESVAEFKRIWTHEEHRRRGLAGKVLGALEAEARGLGYASVYLTTGPRQPEAVRLYLKAGYTPHFDLEADPEAIGHLPFTKELAGA